MKKTMMLWIFFIMSFSMAEKITECYVDPDFYTFDDGSNFLSTEQSKATICQIGNFKFSLGEDNIPSVYKNDKLIASFIFSDSDDEGSSLSYYAGLGHDGNYKYEYGVFPTINGKIGYVQGRDRESIHYNFQHPKDKTVRISVMDLYNNGMASAYFFERLEKFENSDVEFYDSIAAFAKIGTQKYLINRQCAWINNQWQAIKIDKASSIWTLIVDEEKNQTCKNMLPPETEHLKLLEDLP